MKCSVDSLKYFTFVSHTCWFTSKIPQVFIVWQLYLVVANTYEVFIEFHNHFTFDSHMFS